MKELTHWWSATDGASKPWLLLGKGPTFERRNEFDLSGYMTLGMNHVVKLMPLDVVSIADMDVIADCADDIERNAKILLMPRYPHVDQWRTDKRLEEFVLEVPVLRRMSEQGRLVWYYFGNAPVGTDSPEVPRAHFNGELLVNLLAMLGARQIHSLGVDGGIDYSAGFDTKSRLLNGQPSYDLQWDGIASMVRRHGIEYIPLATETPIRVFIGADESQLLGARVLEYSIRKHTPVPVVCDTMQEVHVRKPKHPKNQSRTQFSFNRFAIPGLAGYRGRALYLDADMLVFRNIQELWDIPFDGARVLHAPSSTPQRAKQFSVMLLNCEELRWDVDEIVQGMDDEAYDYEGLMYDLCIESPERVQERVPPGWNSLEQYEPDVTSLIHYTDMRTQPWVSRKNPNGDIWVEYLKAALDDGFIALSEVEEALAMGFVRPSLLSELRARPKSWRFMDQWLASLKDRDYKPHAALAARLGAARKAMKGEQSGDAAVDQQI